MKNFINLTAETITYLINILLILTSFKSQTSIYRVNPKREFFKIDPEQAIALELMAIEDVTPSVQKLKM